MLARLYWMFAGNAALFLLGVSIALRGAGLSWRDLAYSVLALSLPIVRLFDIAWLGGETADGEPATLAHGKRYTIGVLLVSAGLWAAAHLVPRALAS